MTRDIGRADLTADVTRTAGDIVGLFVAKGNALERVYLGAADVEAEHWDSSVPLSDGLFHQVTDAQVTSTDGDLLAYLAWPGRSTHRTHYLAWGEQFLRVRRMVWRGDRLILEASNAVPALARGEDDESYIQLATAKCLSDLVEVTIVEPSPPEPNPSGVPEWYRRQVRKASDALLGDPDVLYTTVRI